MQVERELQQLRGRVSLEQSRRVWRDLSATPEGAAQVCTHLCIYVKIMCWLFLFGLLC